MSACAVCMGARARAGTQCGPGSTAYSGVHVSSRASSFAVVVCDAGSSRRRAAAPSPMPAPGPGPGGD